jgi:hypothetical protein
LNVFFGIVYKTAGKELPYFFVLMSFDSFLKEWNADETDIAKTLKILLLFFCRNILFSHYNLNLRADCKDRT